MALVKRARVALALAVVGSLALAACSSSSKSSSTSNTTAAGASPTTAAGASPTTAAGGSSGAPSGAPVKVLAIDTPITGKTVEHGLKMVEAEINATGGIKGRPLQIIICSDNQDPNAAATCVRNAVSAGAVAEVDRSSSYGASINPVEQANSLAVVGGGIYSQADFAAPNLFPLNAGIFSTIGSAVAAVKILGAKKIGVPYVDVPAGAALPPTIKPLVAALGATTVGAVPVSPTVADITPQVAAEVQANPDIIVDGLTLDAYVKLIKGMRQQGSTTKFMISPGVMDAGLMTTNFGANATGIYQDAEDDYSSPGYQQFLAAFAKYNVDPTDKTGNVIWAWEAVHLFKQVAEQAPSIDAKNILSTVATVNGFTIGNIIPPVDFTKPGTALGGHAPRLFNDELWLFLFQNGGLVPVGSGAGVHTLT